jgi:phosphoglycolate phosphatase-like HAD superfamily hydrolase
MEEPSGDYFAAALLGDVGADLRLRGQNIWNVAQFFTGLVATLLTVSLALVAGVVPSVGIEAGAAAAMVIALVAALLCVGAWYTFVFESFHWARTRRVRERVLRVWHATQSASTVPILSRALELDIALHVGRGSTPAEFRRLVPDSVADDVRWHYLDGLRDETVPARGVRFGLRLVLLLLLIATTIVSIGGGFRFGLTLSPQAWEASAIALVPGVIVLTAWIVLQRSFATSGISRPDPQLILFDLDKTLVDLAPSEAAWTGCNLRAQEVARNAGVAASNGMTAYDVYRLAGQRRGKGSPVAYELSRLLDRQEIEFVTTWGKVAPGVAGLGRLRDAGHCLGIVTSNGRACVDALFSAGRLPKDLFSVVVSRDDVSGIKPSGEPIQVAWASVTQRRPRLSSGWYVGDNAKDREAVCQFSKQHPRHLRSILVGRSVPWWRAWFGRFPSIETFEEWVLELKFDRTYSLFRG